ncbi:MAG: response regulator transcription factor [bacterium]|nr:response regulator transcription factor [bacterium]
MSVTTLVLADDHRAVREGLRARLSDEPDLEIIGEAADGRGALEAVERLQPDVLVVDVVMPHLNGLEVTRCIDALSPRTNVLVLSMYADEAYVLEALQAGARGYVLKSSTAEELVDAIRATATGQTYVGLRISRNILRVFCQTVRDRMPDQCDACSDREQQVMRLVEEGLSDDAIAARLTLSSEEVARTCETIAKKLELISQRDSL